MKKGLGFILGTGSALLATSVAFAQTQIILSPPPGAAASVPLEKVPQFIITLLFVVGIIIALAFLIYGGIKWIISGGDKANVDAARKHIVAAIIGLVIVVSAFVILNFVFKLLFGNAFDLSHLCIPSLDNPTCK
ncbi:MAG: pilin [Patescibacteria group bacterium]|nr:pilin [Patescibacteria group bacterium]